MELFAIMMSYIDHAMNSGHSVKPLFIIGQLLPPTHGSNIMTHVFLRFKLKMLRL